MKRREQIITSAVMCIVSIMVIIGFTVAWYLVSDTVGLTGLDLTAAEQGDIRIALYSESDTSAESEGKRGVDISELTGDDQYVMIGLDQLSNIGFKQPDGTIIYKIAPGTYGDITFYVTPLKSSVTQCSITAEVILKDKLGEEGIPFTRENGEKTLASGESVNVYELAQKHIVFYYYNDADPVRPILIDVTADGSDPGKAAAAVYPLTWDSGVGKGIERPVKLYWKWYYEDPEFESKLAEQTAGKSGSEAAAIERELRDTYKTQINAYDREDTIIGNYINSVQLHFKFTVP